MIKKIKTNSWLLFNIIFKNEYKTKQFFEDIRKIEIFLII